jgi:hypothetical protein
MYENMRVLRAGLGIAVMASLLIGPAGARAGSFEPILAIGQVVARPAGLGAVVEVTGNFGFDDALQVDFPLNLVVYQGKEFVRYPLGGEPISGTFIPLQNGLVARQIPHLEAKGEFEAEAEIVRLEPKRLLVSLPPKFEDGSITAILYVVDPIGGPLLSNAVSATLGDGAGP